MIRTIKTMARAVQASQKRRATAHMMHRLDQRILRDIGLQDWRERL